MENINKNVPIPLYHKSINWQALAYYNFYRILLSGLFLFLIYIGQLPEPLGIFDERLFSRASHVYFFIAIFFSWFIFEQFPRFNLQIAIHVLVDIIILSLLMYSSNGLSSGFGMLLVIAVAGGSILRAGKISILFAAIATLAVLGHELYIQFFRFFHPVNYTHAGILGATFFITAIIGNILAARVRETEALAEQQAIEINELAKLNEHIVQRIQSGIIVLDNSMNIILMNESAKHLLIHPGTDTENAQDYIRGLLKNYMDAWILDNSQQNLIIRPDGSNHELQASFIKLKQGNNYQVLVFIEDIAELRQRAQHLKLASLGRLTASIAHEVRNPLGAINHAGQLLHESLSLTDEDKRLVEIINEHSVRVNNIIENVMSISRRGQSTPEKIKLYSWLIKFTNELKSRFNLSDDLIELKIKNKDLQIKMDPIQAHQVLWNLCENALRYSVGKPLLSICCDISNDTQRPYIDIIDYGDGISEDIKDNLFEPFFTTEQEGSGLGLFLARELCEANQAALSLQASSSEGSIFRVSFMHINKQDQVI